MPVKKQIIVYFIISFVFAKGQKYNFVNFTVEDGLIQSQAMHIVQDKNRYLWIATEGGISKFDGKNFVKYSSQDGIVSNFINKLLCDEEGNIWIGTRKGLSLFNGKEFNTIKDNAKNIGNTNFVTQLNNKIFGVCAFKFCEINANGIKRINISGDTSERLTLLKKVGRNLIAFIYGKGLFAGNGYQWKLIHEISSSQKEMVVRDLVAETDTDTLIATTRGLLVLKNGNTNIYRLRDNTPVNQTVYCATRLYNSVWLGTDQGAYKIENGSMIHFNSRNGLTDNFVYSIFRDAENNLWFASDADGIFKYKENNFSFYDKSFGLISPVIMGVAQTKDETIYAADYSGNLYRINEEYKISPFKIEGGVNDAKINTIYAYEDDLYIGSLGKRIYCYNAKKGLRIIGENAEFKLRGSNCFLKDTKNNLIIGNSQGLFITDEKSLIKKINVPYTAYNSLAQMNDGRVLAGTSNGVLILDTNYQVTFPKVSGLENSEVLCAKYFNGIVWLGTTEHGVFRWVTATDEVTRYDIQQGLASNFIYSLIVRNNNDVWLGTGFGICNLVTDDTGKPIKVKNYGKSDGLIGMECNHTSELLATDSTLWFGTTKGLAHFKPYGVKDEEMKPFVLLRAVKLFSTPIHDSSLCRGFTAWYHLPIGLELSNRQNHLTFELNGIYLSNPDEVLFKYKLEGIDKDFTITNNPVINYPALPPGKYSLIVYALTRSGAESVNSVQYTFEIKKAIYQETWFIVLIFLAGTGIIALIIYIYFRKKQEEKLMREEIREEEFTKLRQRTAEDFHDEMGNKLTRISVLSDILKSKLSTEQKDITHIVTQIRENITALYNGSRDIIWSLNSKNDSLYEIAEHVKHLGNEIFSETQIDFIFHHNIKQEETLKLKLDYSRNLIMIFKEVFNNILKHAAASSVDVRMELIQTNEAIITINDNGRGFELDGEYKGNGLKNIQNRTKRINGQLQILTSPGNGTKTVITLRDIFTDNGKK
jgi:signal transduction histidine kinase/ligand-binding sensor domain-containing protein